MNLPRLPSGYGDPVLLGKGAWGEVWRARQEALERDVALKILPGTRDPEEARRQAALDAPAFPAVYDAFHWHGRTFVAMEWLQGISLEKLLQGGALPEAATWLLGRALARALAEIHRRGLAHGDLKPSNILVLQDGDVRILDLGFSQPLGSAAARCGTPAYMPPEAIQDGAHPADGDLWALALVLGECLLGRRLSAAHEVDRGISALGLTSAWRDLLGRGMASDPQARWPDAEAWTERIEAIPVDEAAARQILSELADPPFRREMSRACLESGQEHLRRGQAQTAFRLVSESLEWDPDHWPAMETLGRIDLGKVSRHRLPWVLGGCLVAAAGLFGYFAGSHRAVIGTARPGLSLSLAPELLGSKRSEGQFRPDGPGFSEGLPPALPASLLVPEECRCTVLVDGAPVAAARPGHYPLDAGHHLVQLRRRGRFLWQGRVKATAYQVVSLHTAAERMK